LWSNSITDYTQAKPTHENIIRLAPPLVISEAQITEVLKIIGEAIKELPSLKGKSEDDIIPASEKGVHIHLDI
jgi:ornithine--oxo-acid transaminase